MNIIEQTTVSTRFMSAILLLMFSMGCTEEPVETFEETPLATEFHFPVMLNEHVLRAEGRSVVINQDEMSEIEVGELTENPDGTLTAVVTFIAGKEGENQQSCEVRVTYRVESASIGGGESEILIHTVEELETLSLATVD